MTCYLIGRLARLRVPRFQFVSYSHSSIRNPQFHVQSHSEISLGQGKVQQPFRDSGQNPDDLEKFRISRNIPRKDKADFLAKTIINVGESKEAVYGTLDAWVAWEEDFPIAEIKRALIILEKEQEWHRMVQVIKWMLSKGQGTTMNTYGMFIRALDMDNRADEAYEFWRRKVGIDMHSVPWPLCSRMITIYYRNKDFDKLIKLFEELEVFDRKLRDKSTVTKVACAYELLGRDKEKERVLEKYSVTVVTKDRSHRQSSSRKKK